MVLSDSEIRARVGMIEPFVERCPPGVISYGLSSGGYDVRLSDEYVVFLGMREDGVIPIVDPKNFDEKLISRRSGPICIIPPNSFVLGRSMERFKIPRDIIATCLGKSTYVRCGILPCVTPLEPEWEGYITIEIANTTPAPAVVYTGEGILQVMFHLLHGGVERSYADKKGVYQGQTGIQTPLVKR